jgi:hypothetical protein
MWIAAGPIGLRLGIDSLHTANRSGASPADHPAAQVAVIACRSRHRHLRGFMFAS